MFPPGFEEEIPISLKNKHAEKRAKKAMQKAQKPPKHLKKPPLTCPCPSPPSQPIQPSIEINTENYLILAGQLGLTFDGPPSVLQIRIDKIL